MPNPTQMVDVDLHRGAALLHLAGAYPSLQDVVEEQVQNSIDCGAQRIEIKINKDTRYCSVRDNGDGAPEKIFHQALQSVGKGIKTPDKMGRFGLGLISPLGKCEKHTFTSCAAPRKKPFLEWTFVTEEIKQQHHQLQIPQTISTNLLFDPENSQSRSGQNVWWRTQVAIFNYTPDQSLSSITFESLSQGIKTKYGLLMAERGILIEITMIEKGKKQSRDVRASSFQGRPLPEFRTIDSDAGEVIIRLYVTKPSQRKKAVNVQFGEIGNKFRFSFPNFIRSSAAEIMPRELTEALKTGIFEGEVLGEKVRLAPQRNCFQKGDAVAGLCACFDDWFQQQGKKYLKEEKEERSALRYQNLGLKTLEHLASVLRNSDALWNSMRNLFQFGTIGTGHASPPDHDVMDEQDQSSLATSRRNGKSKETTEDVVPQSNRPRKEKENHIPFSVEGPRGKPRKTVRHNSIGLQFAYDDLGGSNKLWDLDRTNGILIFNITHPDWVACDKSDRQICALMETIAMMAIVLETMPDKSFAMQQRFYADHLLEVMVIWLNTGGGRTAS